MLVHVVVVERVSAVLEAGEEVVVAAAGDRFTGAGGSNGALVRQRLSPFLYPLM
jgi:hypothetical protein